jgi:hypothetical protein
MSYQGIAQTFIERIAGARHERAVRLTAWGFGIRRTEDYGNPYSALIPAA